MAKPPALESKKSRRRVWRSGAVHKDLEPTPLVRVNPEEPIDAVLVIRDEIRRLQRTGVGSYLFIDPELQAYVVSEVRSVAAAWLKQHFDWLVAFYAPRTKQGSKTVNGVPFMAATVEGLVEDIEQHLKDQRRSAP